MMKIRLSTRSLMVAGIYSLGSLFALTNIGTTTGFATLDFLTITGLSTWTLANTVGLIYRHQTRKKENRVAISPAETAITANKGLRPSSYLTINSALQIVAATSFAAHDVFYEEPSPLIGIRLSGSFFWLSNAILSCIIAQKFFTELEKNSSNEVTCCRMNLSCCNLIGETANQAGAFLYLTYASMLWKNGYFMPLKISASLCWSLGASHDLMVACYAGRPSRAQEANEDVSPASALSTVRIGIN